eukprot:6120062-Amphidinium_carterae.2
MYISSFKGKGYETDCAGNEMESLNEGRRRRRFTTINLKVVRAIGSCLSLGKDGAKDMEL